METRIPLEGDDELTRLAETINFVAASRESWIRENGRCRRKRRHGYALCPMISEHR